MKLILFTCRILVILQPGDTEAALMLLDLQRPLVSGRMAPQTRSWGVDIRSSFHILGLFFSFKELIYCVMFYFTKCIRYQMLELYCTLNTRWMTVRYLTYTLYTLDQKTFCNLATVQMHVIAWLMGIEHQITLLACLSVSPKAQILSFRMSNDKSWNI